MTTNTHDLHASLVACMERRMSMNTAETWAAEINRAVEHTVEAILTTGRLFCAAKAALPHGEFGRMFDDKLVRFQQRAADYLMELAQHPLLSNSQYIANLPPYWSVLVELSRVPQEKLEAGLLDGTVNPTITRPQVVAWRRKLALLPAPPGARPSRATKATRVQQLETVRELAEAGHRSDQIAAAIGVGTLHCRSLMRKHGIVCIADQTVGRARRLNPTRILDALVQSAEEIADSNRLIDFDALPHARLDGWIDSLVVSQRALGRFINRLRQLKETRHVTAATEAHTPHVESSPRPH